MWANLKFRKENMKNRIITESTSSNSTIKTIWKIAFPINLAVSKQQINDIFFSSKCWILRVTSLYAPPKENHI